METHGYGISVRLLVLLLIISSSVSAQQVTPVTATPEIGGNNLPALPIGPDDLIAVSVYGSAELSRTVRVSSVGDIRLPMVRQPIQVRGMMPAALEAVIAQALVSEQVLKDPVVTVTIVEYRSHPISVAGAVKRPITFQAYGNITLLDALARADGLSQDAGSEILVSRMRKDENGKTRNLVQRIPLRGLIDAADPELNLKLEGGEEIRVPEVGKIFVVGSVKKPGAYHVDDGNDTTIMKALALSEGLLPYADKTAYIYRQEGGAGSKKNEIAIPLQQIVRRKSPDLQLMANDILYIPDRTGRRIAMTTIEKLLFSLGGPVIYTVAR